MAVTRELMIFIYFILEGIVGGILMDLLRACRRNRKVHDLVVYLEDFVYWLVIGGLVIWLSYTLDAGTIRMYMILGVFLGMLIYFLTLTKIVYKVFDFICRYLLRLIRWIFNKFKGATNEKESQLA